MPPVAGPFHSGSPFAGDSLNSNREGEFGRDWSAARPKVDRVPLDHEARGELGEEDGIPGAEYRQSKRRSRTWTCVAEYLHAIRVGSHLSVEYRSPGSMKTKMISLIR